MTERVAIVVVGMHRAGSSAMARLLSLAGATLPKFLMAAGEGNETGHWEPQRVADYNDTVLAAFDGTWDSPFGLGMNATRRAGLDPFVQGARDIVREEYGDAPLIVLKEPRISLVADLWTMALEAEGFRCKFVITLRPPTEVALSLRKRNGFALDKGLLLWGAYQASAELLTRSHDRVFCRFDDVLARPASVLDDIEAKLRIELPRRTAQAHAEMDAFVRPALKRNDTTAIPDVPDHLRRITDLSNYLLAAMVGDIPNSDVSSALQTWLSELDQTITPLVIGIEQQLRAEQERAVALSQGQVETYRAEIERGNTLYDEQRAEIARLEAQGREIDEVRRATEQLALAAEQARLTTQAHLEEREVEMAALQGASEVTESVIGELSAKLDGRTAELLESRADNDAKAALILALSDENARLEVACAEANAALAAQSAENVRSRMEADAADARWHAREADLVAQAESLSAASDQAMLLHRQQVHAFECAAQEQAATLDLIEARYREESAERSLAMQVREAELEAALESSRAAQAELAVRPSILHRLKAVFVSPRVAATGERDV